MRVSEPKLFIETPDKGTSVFGGASYPRATGTDMLCEYRYEVISDLDQSAFRKWSTDNGRTWGDPVQLPVTRTQADGATWRRSCSPCFVDSEHRTTSGPAFR